MEHHKKLYRSRTNRIIGGVCAGIAEYVDIDPAVIRLVWALVVVFTAFFPGILVYLIALVIIPPHHG
jgi:phage shock protein C